MSELELHPERLGTTDERGRRVFPQPAHVDGRYRVRRTRVQAALILFFLLLPWARVAGRQALLLDVANRKFEIFGLSLRAHNAPLLVFVLGAFVFGLFFVTAIWGRVWCGWACPQTVFIDGVFRRIERWIEGSALQRRRLDREPMSFRKLRLRAAKWAAYGAVCLVLSHSLLAYFVGTDALARMLARSPLESWTTFVAMASIAGFLLFNFGWFREQFCVIACPYGRFQSVLMDSSSLIVAYDVARGEPRATPQSRAAAKTLGAKLGDCVNCYRCVQVCPVGIDIRRGVQLECIACSACIDACDEVMTKTRKPLGLIRYDSLLGLEKKPVPRARPRAAIYGLATLASLAGLSFLLSALKPVEVTVLRSSESPYQVLETAAGAVVVNHFKLEISNESDDDHALDFASDDKALALTSAIRPLPVKRNGIMRASLFISFPKSILTNGQTKTRIRFVDVDVKTGEKIETEKDVALVGPFG